MLKNKKKSKRNKIALIKNWIISAKPNKMNNVRRMRSNKESVIAKSRKKMISTRSSERSKMKLAKKHLKNSSRLLQSVIDNSYLITNVLRKKMLSVLELNVKRSNPH